jgi:hypothetical protein
MGNSHILDDGAAQGQQGKYAERLFYLHCDLVNAHYNQARKAI